MKLVFAIATPLSPSVDAIVQETVLATETITASPKNVDPGSLFLIPNLITSPSPPYPDVPKVVPVPVTVFVA